MRSLLRGRELYLNVKVNENKIKGRKELFMALYPVGKRTREAVENGIKNEGVCWCLV